MSNTDNPETKVVADMVNGHKIDKATERMKNFGEALSKLLAEIAKDKTPQEMFEWMNE